MTLAQAARKQMRADGGSYRRDHLRLLAQRVEVADKEVRIMGSKLDFVPVSGNSTPR
jgi:site-specific DNA recombinase